MKKAFISKRIINTLCFLMVLMAPVMCVSFIVIQSKMPKVLSHGVIITQERIESDIYIMRKELSEARQDIDDLRQLIDILYGRVDEVCGR